MADLPSRIGDALPDLRDGGGGGSSNYPYVTARVRSKRKFLLDEDEYPKLLARDAHEIARTLQEGQYKDEIDDLAGRRSGADLVEHATRRNLAATYREILGWCKGDLARMVRLYLGRYDVYNLKTLLRGKFADVPDEEIRSTLVPAGRMSEEELEALLATPGLDELIAAIDDPGFRTALRRVAGEDATAADLDNLMPLENALDQEYYRRLLASVDPKTKAKRVFRDFLQREVDLLNLKTLLRIRVDDIEEVEPYFVEGGDEVTLPLLRSSAAVSIEELPPLLETLSFYDDIQDPLEAFVEDRDLDAFVTALDQYLIECARGFTVNHPLSILPVIDFILRKRVEAHNLRAISHGKEHGLPDETIEELLIT